jgi:hypothetical protein
MSEIDTIYKQRFLHAVGAMGLLLYAAMLSVAWFDDRDLFWALLLVPTGCTAAIGGLLFLAHWYASREGTDA